jgi:DNA transformation protein
VTSDDDDALTTIRNIGPAMAADLVRAGISSAAMLREIGADAAYRRMLASGTRPHFIAYYVLHMALQGRPWNDCKGAEKEALRLRFDAIVADTPKDGRTAFEEMLDQIGTGARR